MPSMGWPGCASSACRSSGVSGRLTSSPLAVREVEAACDVPVFGIDELRDPSVARGDSLACPRSRRGSPVTGCSSVAVGAGGGPSGGRSVGRCDRGRPPVTSSVAAALRIPRAQIATLVLVGIAAGDDPGDAGPAAPPDHRGARGPEPADGHHRGLDRAPGRGPARERRPSRPRIHASASGWATSASRSCA